MIRARRSRIPSTAWPALAALVVVLLCACSARLPAPIEDRTVAGPQARRGAASSAPAIKPAPHTAAPAESEARPQTYTVKRGDTLYLIALDHGLDYRELAAWNSIENVNLIRVGQVLRLTPPGADAGATAANAASAPGAASTSGVTTAPLKSVAPIVGSGAPTPSAPTGNAATTTSQANAGSTAPVPSAAERTPPPAVASRNSENYKTSPKASKEPYSERALHEMQQRFQSSSTVASAPATAASPAPATAPSSSGSTAASASSAPSMPEVNAPPVATAPTNIARNEPKLEPKTPPSSSSDEDDDNKLDWVWPATGKLVTGFSDTANLKGIDIAGKSGQAVLASAAGKVVYAGTGLRGYGKLIIIKHSKNYLSAYAHNKDILVKEGQQVTRGQKIAEMGNTDADQVKLHFEIRRLGKPMDPLKFLPPAS